MFFKILYRNWKKNTISLIIRLLGLIISLSFVTLLLIYILYENNHDNHIRNKDNIYRMLLHYKSFSSTDATTPFFPKSEINNHLPEVLDIIRIIKIPDLSIIKGENQIPENRFYCADFEIFRTLDIQLIEGDISNLDFTHYIAISRNISEKYFPDGNAVGNLLSLYQSGKELSAIVIAVYDDIPENSTFRADIIGNFKIQFDLYGKDFSNEAFENLLHYNYFTTYISLANGIDPTIVASKLTRIFYSDKDSDNAIRLQRLKDIYSGSKELLNNTLPSGSRLNINLFTIICSFIVLIACSNFALITATYHFHRKREYFIRSIHGATRNEIIKLVLGEIIPIMIISLVFSIILTFILHPFVSEIFGKQISLDKQSFAWLIIILTIILAFIVLIAILVTFILLSPKLKRRLHASDFPSVLPSFKFIKLLVLGQIAVFSSLIVISVILINQWKFIKNKESLGFDPHNLFVLEIPLKLNEHIKTFIGELQNNPQILSIAESGYIPLSGPTCLRTMFITDDYSHPSSIVSINVGSNFFKTIGLSLTEGREFDLTGNYDMNNSIMLNESAVRYLHLESPIGKTVAFKEVIGVVKDFPIISLYEKITPLFIFPENNQSFYIVIRYQGDHSTLYNYISEKHKELTMHSNLRLDNFNTFIDQTYVHERKLKSMFVFFTAIAVILGILGITGLLIFTIQKRSKEIAIRIIHGASFANIVSLISREFLITILISNIIAYPIIWYVANKWLINFSNHIEINSLPFLLGTGMTIVISLALVSIIAFMQIRMNPVKNINR